MLDSWDGHPLLHPHGLCSETILQDTAEMIKNLFLPQTSLSGGEALLSVHLPSHGLFLWNKYLSLLAVALCSM